MTRATDEFSAYKLPGLELTGRGDSGRAELGRAAPQTRLGDSSTTDKLVQFVRANRQSIEQMMRAQGELSSALQEFASIMKELDAADQAEGVAKSAGEAPSQDLEIVAENVASDASDEVEKAPDGSVVGRHPRQEHYREARQEGKGRQTYTVQEGDTLEYIAQALFSDERVNVLIHELNKDWLPTTYADDWIIVEPGQALVGRHRRCGGVSRCDPRGWCFASSCASRGPHHGVMGKLKCSCLSNSA